MRARLLLLLVPLAAVVVAACALDSSLTCGDTCADAAGADATGADAANDAPAAETSTDASSPDSADVSTPCVGDGGACQASTDCCSGACSGNHRCVGQCGKSVGAACSFQSACCVGLYCTNDAGCAACVAVGLYCGDDNWCCSGHCNDNNGDAGNQCVP